MLHTSAVPCWCVYMVRESHFYFSLSFLTSKNMSGTLFVIWFLLHTLFDLFCGSLTCKYVTRLYVPAVKVLNRPATACLLVYKSRKSQPYPFFHSWSIQKLKSNLFSCLKSCKYFSRAQLYVLQHLKTSSIHCPLNFKLQKHQPYFSLPFPLTDYPIYVLF